MQGPGAPEKEPHLLGASITFLALGPPVPDP